MENSILKKRKSYPFETIGVAVAFSPRLKANLAEAKRLSDLFNAKLVFIHVGKFSEEKNFALNQEIANLNFNSSLFKIAWEEGNPADVILRVCKENVVDLLMVGAMEKENIFKFYIGSLSRELCRKAKCSVLIFTEPSVHGTSFKNIVVNCPEHPKTKHMLETAIYLGTHEKVNSVHVVRELYLPALIMGSTENVSKPDEVKFSLIEEEHEKLESLLSTIDSKEIQFEAKTILGKIGHAVSEFAKESDSDLLVINSPDNKHTILDRLFVHDIEYILAAIPCNLLIVHSRVENEIKNSST